MRLLDVHTVVGVLALVVWASSWSPEDSPIGTRWSGSSALGLSGSITIVGLLILVRWLPSHGKHASEAAQTTAGPRGRVCPCSRTSACWSA